MPAASAPLARHAALVAVLALLSTPPLARGEPGGDCGAPATRVHAIQGSGRSSPLRGLEVAVEGVVIAVFPGLPQGLGGFFLQEEDVDTDDDPSTSEGLFVFGDGLGAGLGVGQRVRVWGRVSEFFGLTELSQLRGLEVCPPGGRASAVELRLPVDTPEAWEQWEGMHVRLEQPLSLTDHADLARYGELELAAGGRLWQPTHRETPGSAAADLARRNDRRRILLDDGSDALDPDPAPYLWRTDGGSLRLQDRLQRLDGVLDYAFGRFRIHPTAPVRFEPGEARPRQPPALPGTLRVVAWNLHNHFNGDGHGGGFPTRGPASPDELGRQRAKLVATLVALDPDVALLVELENDGVGPDSALAQLAEQLSQASPNGRYLPVDPGLPRLGNQAIAVGMLYRPNALVPIGHPAVLDQRAHPGFDSARNRPSLAHSFASRATGEPVTLVVNHFKSKGSSCQAAGDPDLGDGQGDCNDTRRLAAHALLDWLAADPTGVGRAPVLIAGDLNAYPREDPVRALESGGYVDLLAWLAGPDAYSYVFEGEAGRLDHALGSADLLRFVAGAAVWHTNADEPSGLDYRAAGPRGFAPDPFRASDHDPLLVGLFPDRDRDAVTDARDRCPDSAPGPTLRLGRCDSHAPERRDAEGCYLSDRLRALLESDATRASRLRDVRRWLARHVAEGSVAQRDRGRILACAARWQ